MTTDQGADDRCPHGMTGGAEPDPWLAGRLRCPLCRAEAGEGAT